MLPTTLWLWQAERDTSPLVSQRWVPDCIAPLREPWSPRWQWQRKLKFCYLQIIGVEGKWESPQVLFCPMAFTHSSQSSKANLLAGIHSLSALEGSVSTFLYQCSLAVRGNHKTFNIEKASDYLNLLPVTLAVPVYAPCFLLSPDGQLCRIMHINCS